jgi:GTP-binding protein EngB required for normal cell division
VDLDQLARDLAQLSFIPGTDAAPADSRRLQRCRRLLDVKLRFESRRGPQASPIVVVAGGTNVGKSTVFNWLAAEVVSKSSPIARFTKAPAVYVHESEKEALADGAFLPGYQKLSLEKPEQLSGEGEGLRVFLRTHARPEAAGVVLLDSPDIDSTHERNRAVAQDLLDLADAIVFVATPEKYNDDVCVEYLREAADAGKRLICVLNKGAQEEVAADFRGVLSNVFAQGPADATPRDFQVLRVPYLEQPTPSAQGPWRESLRVEAVAPGKAGAQVRSFALDGTRRRLGRELRELASRLRGELGQLDRIRAEADAVVEQSGREYRAFLDRLTFFELDRVYERVLEYFRIPVIDDVYDGMRAVVGAVGDVVRSVVSGSHAQDPKAARIAARRDVDRETAKLLIENAASRVAKLPETAAGPLAKVAAAWVPPLPSPEQVNQDTERFLQRADEEAERWVEAETRRHIEFFREHPNLRASLQVMKGAFQIGFGVVSGYLTGGLLKFSGIEEVASAVVAERAMKSMVERMGGVVHYQTLKSDYTRDRAALFAALVADVVRRPLLERLPTGSDPQTLERVEAAAREMG